jgi:hypothetical protein
MILDKLLRFSNAQAVTVTAVSTDKADLSVARDVAEGEPLFVNFAIGAAFTGGTSTAFEVVVADDAALTSNVTIIGSSGALLTAALTAGKTIAVALNPLVGSLGKRYTVVGANTAGTVTADLTDGVQDGLKFYAGGFSVI